MPDLKVATVIYRACKLRVCFSHLFPQVQFGFTYGVIEPPSKRPWRKSEDFLFGRANRVMLRFA